MIKLKRIVQEMMEKEGIRYAAGSTDNNIKLELDFTKDDVNDLLLLSDTHENTKLKISHASNPRILTYRAFAFNESSKFFNGLDRKDINLRKNEIRHALKRIDKSAMEYDKFVKMIDISIDRFDKLSETEKRFEIKTGMKTSKIGELFSLVIPMPSKSKLNDLIIQRMQLKHKNIISYNTFKKMMTDDVTLNMDKINAQVSNPETKKQIVNFYNDVLSSHIGQPFEVKFFKTGFRRYLHFLTFVDDSSKQILNRIVNGNILLIDDTIGEGNTFNEAIRLMAEYKPANIFCYAFLKDY